MRFKMISLSIAGALMMCGTAFAQSPGTAPMAKPSTSMAKPSTAVTKAAPKTDLLDINSASKPDLVALKGIGDKRADDIIKGRPYKGKDELYQKKIIPKGVYESIKDKIIAKQK